MKKSEKIFEELVKARMDLFVEDGSPEMFRALEKKIAKLEEEYYLAKLKETKK